MSPTARATGKAGRDGASLAPSRCKRFAGLIAGRKKLKALCLDLEGVLTPEIWQAVAARTGIDALNKTTRDIPDYDQLMRFRLEVMEKRQLPLSAIWEAIGGLAPLAGAREFLDWARRRHQVAVVSDTFYEFVAPLMAKLSWPFLLCHHLDVENGRIAGYRLRQPDPKRSVVKAFKSLNMKVLAAGDSFNDLPMLEEADAGFFFRAPAKVRARFPQYPVAQSYEALRALVESA